MENKEKQLPEYQIVEDVDDLFYVEKKIGNIWVRLSHDGQIAQKRFDRYIDKTDYVSKEQALEAIRRFLRGPVIHAVNITEKPIEPKK